MVACLPILGILFLKYMHTSADITTIKVRKDTSHSDRIIENGNVGNIITRSLFSYTDRCMMTGGCMSMFYNSHTKQCVLHQFCGAYLDLLPGITNTSGGWNYYERVEGFGLSTRCEECITSGFLCDPAADACYFMKTMVFDFDVINQQCADLKSQLIKIATQEKQDWIMSKLVTNTEPWVCIQGNNDNIITQYQFDDGAEMTYFNWYTGQPNGGTDHYLIMQEMNNYMWHDSRKSYPGVQCLIICEK